MADNRSKEQRRAEADSKFKRLEEVKSDRLLASREYRDAQQAEREKTVRLRDLRLARDSALKNG